MVRRISKKYGGGLLKAFETLAQTVAVEMNLCWAPLYDFSDRDLSYIEKLERATLRTIMRLSKHTRKKVLLNLVTISALRNIIIEARIRIRTELKNTTKRKGITAGDEQVDMMMEPA